MKELIRKILREQEDAMDTHAEKVQDLESADELGGFRNPIIDDSPGNVPPTSYSGEKYNHKTKRYYKPTISKNIFFKAVQILNKMKDASWFTQQEDSGDNLWHRQQDMSTSLKVLGIEGEGLADKIYWAANDNRIGILDGSITNYDQLWLRPLVEYKIPLFESAREYKTIYWSPKTECYSKEDAFNTVMYDEDGIYDSWEWDGDPSYQIDSDEWDSEGKELDSEIEVVKTLYPGEKGSESIKESINEEIGPSPEENDIISELNEMVQSWESGKYKNQVQEIINRYKSKSLYEHTDNFTSHHNEPHIGDRVVNTNPGCTHYQSEGVIEDINDLPDDVGITITYRVSNDGETYTNGDMLTKTADQLEPL